MMRKLSDPLTYFTLQSLQACGQYDSFVIKLNPTGSSPPYPREYATCLGGSSTDEGHALTVDAYGNAYVTGYTHSTNFPTSANFPTVNSSFQPNLGGAGFEDAFVAKISTDSDTDGYSTAQGDCNDSNAAIHPDATELCNGRDDNCSGGSDETFTDLGSTCMGGMGACQRRVARRSAPVIWRARGAGCARMPCQQSGTKVCASDGLSTQCNATPGTPSAESCNNQDDDCDGAIDESSTDPLSPLTQSCYDGPAGTEGIGLCQAGVQTCSNGQFTACVGAVTPTAETCNGQADLDGDGLGDACDSLSYAFGGFFSPVDNLPTLNMTKAGGAIPVKFSLGGNQGLTIFEAGYPKSQTIACDSTAPVDGIEETITAGGSSLSYDATTDQYKYVWKTEKGWGNTCRQSERSHRKHCQNSCVC